MIAVFTTHRELNTVDLTPKSMFRHIKSMDDICGVRFTGVILLHDWYNYNRQMYSIFETLRARQPELFKNK